MIIRLKNIFPKIFFLLTTLTSYIIFLIYYDSTTGIDYPNKYFTYINYFSFNSNLNPQDGQGLLYYFFISQIVDSKMGNLGPNNLNEILNNAIQLGNLLLVLLGYLGLYKLYNLLDLSKNTILIGLSFLNFFPPLIYLRLTYKSEVLAFTLLPWILYFFEKNKIKKTDTGTYEIILIIALSLLLTIKPAVTAMVIIPIFIFGRAYLREHIRAFITVLIVSSILLYINYNLSGLSFLSFIDKYGNWNNKASFSFFTKLNLVSLFSEPFFNKNSDSLYSIILLDTYSDYFRFYWKHKEPTNYLAFGQVNFTKNFYIEKYLRDYFAIILTLLTYFGFLYYFFKNKNDQHKWFLLFPFIGLLCLSINSLGIPSNNFNPESGDTFKTHYYSFLLIISTFHLITKNKKILFSSVLLIPIFIFIMGFPKNNLSETSYLLSYKFNNSEMCISLDETSNCNNDFINVCKRSGQIIYVEDSNRFRVEEFFQPVMLSRNNNTVYARNTLECLNFLNLGFEYKGKISN